jgi:ligand-binding SRPBCC domain-containing protein
MTQKFETRQWVPFPVEQVFAFFANPGNLPRLMPPELRTRIEELRLEPPPPCLSDCENEVMNPSVGIGSEIVISFSPVEWLRYRVQWTARITNFVWNSHFCDEQTEGPFKFFRHRHGTIRKDREGRPGTLVTDDIEFALPYGPVGWMTAPLVRRRLKRSFTERQKRLMDLLAVERVLRRVLATEDVARATF